MAKLLPLLLGLVVLGGLVLFLVGDGERGRRAPPGGRSAAGNAPATPAPADPTELAPTEPAAGSGRTAASAPRPEPGALDPRRAPRRILQARVVADGAPLRGAQALVYASGTLVANGESNPQGLVEVAFPVPAEDLVLRIAARGFAVLERELGSQQVPGQTQLGNVFLQRGSLLEGTVVDTEGRPVAGAEVTLSQVPGRALRPGLGEHARSDARGRFRFPNAPESFVTLVARAEGYGLRTLDHQHGGGNEPRIVLAPGTDLAVRVVDAHEQPVAGVRLILRARDASAPPREEVSDDAGGAVFAGLLPGHRTLRAEKRGFKPSRLSEIAPATREVQLRLVAWPRALGEVRTPDGGPPPAGTRVYAVFDADPRLAEPSLVEGFGSAGAQVDARGRFVLGDLRPGAYRARVVAPGYAPTDSETFHAGELEDVRVPTVTLRRGGGLWLRVLEDGAPRAGVRAQLLDRAPRPGQLWQPAHGLEDVRSASDAEGDLRLDDLPPGSWWLILRSPEHVPRELGPFSVSSGTTPREPREVELEPGGRLRGRITTPEGSERAAMARVHLEGPAQGLPFLVADPRGTFTSERLPPGTYVLTVTSIQGEDLVESEPRNVVVTSGQDTVVEIPLP